MKNLNSEQFSNSSVFQVLELTLIGLLLPLIVFSVALFTKILIVQSLNKSTWARKALLAT